MVPNSDSKGADAKAVALDAEALAAHFRDVRGTAEKFEETFHDEGKTDMLACMEAYSDSGINGVYRPDHVPTMEGDSNDNPSYSSVGRLFAIGYLKGLQEAVVGHTA